VLGWASAQDGSSNADHGDGSLVGSKKAVAADVAKRLGITKTTLYTYVNGDGSPKAAGTALLSTETGDESPDTASTVQRSA
jgi:hypothetical protein